MDWENLLALITAVALVGYLVYTLLHPELLTCSSLTS